MAAADPRRRRSGGAVVRQLVAVAQKTTSTYDPQANELRDEQKPRLASGEHAIR